MKNFFVIDEKLFFVIDGYEARVTECFSALSFFLEAQ